MAARQHKHTPKGSAARFGHEYPWTLCVTPVECAAHPERQAAHGGIVRVDTCRCGATRSIEQNGFHPANYGPWVEPAT